MKSKEDIGLVVVTKREALFMKVRDINQKLIDNAKEDIEVYTETVKRAEEVIKEEHAH